MRSALITFGAVGGLVVATMLLSGALVDEVNAPNATRAVVTRYAGPPVDIDGDGEDDADGVGDPAGGLCKLDATWEVAFADQAAAAALGLPPGVEADRVLILPCSAVATLLNTSPACKASDSFPPGWPVVGLGNPAACSDPSTDGGSP